MEPKFKPQIYQLDNSIQNYDWGSKSALEKIYGIPNELKEPQAELWIGAHPKAPSMVIVDEKQKIPLDKLIEMNPNEILGSRVMKKFNRGMPFLFKILCAEKPLSIQTHPSRQLAEKGFLKESNQQIDLADPIRNYRDSNHKPEILYALTEFEAFHNFKSPSKIKKAFQHFESKFSKSLALTLDFSEPSEALKAFYTKLMLMDSQSKNTLIKQILNQIKLEPENKDYKLINWLNQFYPNDFGILAPLYMEYIKIKPGQCLFIDAGEIHFYLRGSGIEIMANSDNVIRGGLTHKHIDIKELLKVLDFQVSPITSKFVKAHHEGNLIKFKPPIPDFELNIVTINNKPITIIPDTIEILFCQNGNPTIFDRSNKAEARLSPGKSVLIPASLEEYQIRGQGLLMRTIVPLK